MSYRVIHGDCQDELKKLIDEGTQVDSIVTDPPYELGFMGKSWDSTGIAYSIELWKLALQALKPGGHLLSFGGSRTYHRMACAIEDAGFEIRDSIRYLQEMHYPAYVFGQGFPKSLNVKKAATKQGLCCVCEENPLPYSHEEKEATKQNAEHDLRSMRSSYLSSTFTANSAEKEAVFKGMQKQDVSDERAQTLAEYEDGKKPSMEGRSDLFQEEGELYGSEICKMPSRLSANGKEGWICDGASTDNGNENRSSAYANGSGESHSSQSSEQQLRELGVISNECRSQKRGSWEICTRCSKPILPEGLGSALKPAWEPVVVARRPLEKGLTIAENVIKHGTGGINVDGCRVGYQNEDDKNESQFKNQYLQTDKDPDKMFIGVKNQGDYNPPGRFPSNLIHDGSDEVEAEFAKYGERVSKYAKSNVPLPDGIAFKMGRYGEDRREASNRFVGDKGSASRFFYSAKASSKDRQGSKHPTVKPLALMRYLCRLVTQPGGTVLDMFAGSGTTGQAALEEGFNCILIEKEAEYIKDINKRLDNIALPLWKVNKEEIDGSNVL